jgi:hypothetical protein
LTPFLDTFSFIYVSFGLELDVLVSQPFIEFEVKICKGFMRLEHPMLECAGPAGMELCMMTCMDMESKLYFT